MKIGYITFAKSEIIDGFLHVSGVASSASVDHDGEIVEPDALKGAWDDYAKFGNIREMHSPKAAGVVTAHSFDDDGILHITVKVVDAAAATKVQEGVYKGFSIGGRVLSKKGNRITKIRLNEISLVDRPANPDAVFDCYKMADDEEKAIAAAEEEDYIDRLAKALQKRGIGVVKPVGVLQKSGEPITILEKGVYQLQTLISVVSQLRDAIKSAEWEAAFEGDPQGLVTALRAACSNVSSIVASYALEELMEKSMTDKTMALTADNIRKAFGPDVTADAITKALAPPEDPTVAALKKAVEDATSPLQKQLDELQAKLTKLESTPLPGGPRASQPRVIGKAADNGTEADPADDPNATAADVMKAVHAKGGQRFAG